MRCSWTFKILLGIAWMTPAAQAEETPPIDYSKLNFQVSLKSLRSGNHDEKGQNEYYLKSTLIGLPLLKEDAKKPFAERKKIERPLGEFSQIKIPNLKYWAGEKKLGPPFLQSVSGETIREVVGETMRTYKAEEELVSILYKLEMYERNKLFGLVGEDTKVGVTEFFIIPEVPPRAPKVENQVLQISDTQGLRVELQITFASLETKKP